MVFPWFSQPQTHGVSPTEAVAQPAAAWAVAEASVESRLGTVPPRLDPWIHALKEDSGGKTPGRK